MALHEAYCRFRRSYNWILGYALSQETHTHEKRL